MHQQTTKMGKRTQIELGIKMRNSMKGGVAVAVLAIAFSADAFLPDTVPPIVAGQAFAASVNSNGNGSSGDNGNGGRSADARSDSGNASSSGGPASSQGKGRGLLRLLAIGGGKPSSADSTAPTGVATGAPLQLLPSQPDGAATETAFSGPPDPKPVSPVTAYVMETVEDTGQAPGEIHRLLGAGHSYFNSNEQAKLNAAPNSRIKRVERYLVANAAAQTAGGVASTVANYAEAQAYLDAVAVLEAEAAVPGAYTTDQIVEAQVIIAGSVFGTAAEAQAVVVTYETLVALFEEADNQPYDADRRAVYDGLAAYLGPAF